MSISTLTLAASLGLALQAAPAMSDVSIRIIGHGSLACTFQTEDGEIERSERARRSGEFETVRASDVLSAACRYDVPEGRDLHIRIMEADGFACPFDPDAEIDDCTATMRGAGEGAFALERG